MTLTYVMQQLLNGIVVGCLYALLALGMNTVYGILRLINFAHGVLVTIGAFCFYLSFTMLGLPLIAMIGVVIAIGALMGIVLDTVAYRKLRGGPEVSLLITSLGFYIFMENLIKLLASPQPYAVRPPVFLTKVYEVGIRIRMVDVSIILISLVIMALYTYFVRRTRLGTAMRALSESIEGARMVGIETNRVISLAFMLCSAIAAITGSMWAMKYGQISYNMGFIMGVKAFVGCVIGGVGSIPGAMVGGLILGIVEVLAVGLLPAGSGLYSSIIVFAILILVLLFKPSGIMGRKEEVY